jgi:hypothetical protein
MLSSIGPAILSSGFISYTKFPDYFGKISKLRKTQRQLKELKMMFPHDSLQCIKEDVAPIILSKLTDYLVNSGKEGVEQAARLLKEYKLTLFKDNIIDIQTKQSIITRYEKLTPSLKTALTRRLNEENKSAIVKKKKKGKYVE